MVSLVLSHYVEYALSQMWGTGLAREQHRQGFLADQPGSGQDGSRGSQGFELSLCRVGGGVGARLREETENWERLRASWEVDGEEEGDCWGVEPGGGS